MVLPEQANGVNNIGGLSGISYNPVKGSYIAVADKYPARLIILNDSSLLPEDIIMLKPAPISSSELEGIAFDSLSSGYYLADEQTAGTRMMKVKDNGEFIELILPKNQPMIPLSGHNSGIEGLALNKTGSRLFFAFERPTESCFDYQITTIGQVDLDNGKVDLFAYKLHQVDGDLLNTNGISEVLVINDSTLLVMERAYIPETGNIVRLYEAVLKDPVPYEAAALNCETSRGAVETELVFDFKTVEEFNIDNAEGMTFNKDRSELIIVTDNNFSGRQETQVVTLRVRWKSEDGRPK